MESKPRYFNDLGINYLPILSTRAVFRIKVSGERPRREEDEREEELVRGNIKCAAMILFPLGADSPSVLISEFHLILV